jgi:hypothetical protein
LTAVDDKESFLSRWSRRKLETKADAPAGATQAAGLPAAPAATLASEPAAVASAEDLTPEYREFFDPKVDERLRRTALKKLFSEPQFNVMDGLDTYIDDYSKPDPIPEAMLRQLNQAKDLFLFDDEKEASQGASGTTSSAAGEGAAPSAATETGTLPQAPLAGASDEAAGAASGSGTAPLAQGSRNS